MSRTRKFFRSVLEVEVLSEEPVSFNNLQEVHHAVTEGGCSGSIKVKIRNQSVTGVRMARLLEKQGSDPEFFGLTSSGRPDRSGRAWPTDADSAGRPR